MQNEFRKIRIFVASPSDVEREREELARVINEINLTIQAIAPEKRVVIELVRYETHTTPDLGDGPQPVISRQIGEYDIFVGVLWKRMGTPTATASSGTEEEFNHAYALWQQDKTRPVLLYFCRARFPPPQLRDEVEQLGRVVEFRQRASSLGLVWDYEEHDQFADVIRPHLLLVVGRMLAPTHSATELARNLAQQRVSADTSGVRQQIASLASEYERVRETMVAGDTRTMKMEAIASRMRSLALAGHTLVPELAESTSPGHRLAGVMMLQTVPKTEFLEWLARRLGAEKPFVAYQSAMALLTGVRALRKTHERELRQSLALAQEEFRKTYRGTGGDTADRLRVLQEAVKELDQL